MHIEPERVDTTHLLMSYATAVMVLVTFDVLPTQPMGLSEVHLILGSTLLLRLVCLSYIWSRWRTRGFWSFLSGSSACKVRLWSIHTFWPQPKADA